MSASAMRKGSVERSEVSGSEAKTQDALNSPNAKEYPDNVAPENKTTKYLNSGGSSAPPYGGKGHAGA